MTYLYPKHPAICWCLLPWFMEGNQTRQEIFLELYARLEQDPDNTYVVVALDGDVCHGFMVAYKDEDEIWVWQAKALRDFGKTKEVVEHLTAWAKERGATIIKGQCSKDRNTRLIMRRFGFKKSGNTIQRNIA